MTNSYVAIAEQAHKLGFYTPDESAKREVSDEDGRYAAIQASIVHEIIYRPDGDHLIVDGCTVKWCWNGVAVNGSKLQTRIIGHWPTEQEATIAMASLQLLIG